MREFEEHKNMSDKQEIKKPFTESFEDIKAFNQKMNSPEYIKKVQDFHNQVNSYSIEDLFELYNI